MTTPTILTSADVGAPTLDGQAGSLRNVMKWALPLLGWTEEFDDAVNHEVAFRNNPVTGSGSYIRFRDNSPITTSRNHYAEMHAFTAMTAIDSGTNQCPPNPINTDNLNNTIIKAYINNSASPTEYKIIGTDRGFFLLTNIGASYIATYAGWAFHWVGDMRDTAPGDNPFFIFGWYGDNTASASCVLGLYSVLPTTDPTSRCPYALLDLSGAVAGHVVAPVGWAPALIGNSSNPHSPGYASNSPNASPMNARYDFIQPSLWEVETDTGLRTAQGHIYRGFWEGLFLPAAGNYVAEYALNVANGGDPAANGMATLPAFPFPDGARDTTLYMCTGSNSATSSFWWCVIDDAGDWYA